jgi:D-alanyl-D-alanine carboxypeptidase
MTDAPSRREMIAGMTACALPAAGFRARLPGPPMFSVGLIARRGNGRIAARLVESLTPQSQPATRPFSLDDPFRVASVSKMVSAMVFMQLAREKGVDLDGDASAYLDAPLRHPAHPDIAITPRMLMAHTSGLRNGDDLPLSFNRALMDRLSAAAREPRYGGWFAPPAETPGRFFCYSDVNFAVLAQIMERLSGKRFDLLMHDRLFQPLGLDIGYNWSGVSQRKRSRAAAGWRFLDGAWTTQVDAAPPRAPDVALYRETGAESQTLESYRRGSNGFAFAAHGGLRLSLRDMDAMARFCARGAPLLGAGVLEEMSRPVWTYDPSAPNGATENGFFGAFGLSVQVSGSGRDAYFGARSADWRGHFGDAYGWMTGLFWNTRTKATIVYAVNGMPETERPPGVRTALTGPEEAVLDHALSRLG